MVEDGGLWALAYVPHNKWVKDNPMQRISVEPCTLGIRRRTVLGGCEAWQFPRQRVPSPAYDSFRIEPLPKHAINECNGDVSPVGQVSFVSGSECSFFFSASIHSSILFRMPPSVHSLWAFCNLSSSASMIALSLGESIFECVNEGVPTP